MRVLPGRCPIHRRTRCHSLTTPLRQPPVPPGGCPVRARTPIDSPPGRPRRPRVHPSRCPIHGRTRIDSPTPQLPHPARCQSPMPLPGPQSHPRPPLERLAQSSACASETAAKSEVALASPPRLAHSASCKRTQAAARPPVARQPPLDWPAPPAASACKPLSGQRSHSHPVLDRRISPAASAPGQTPSLWFPSHSLRGGASPPGASALKPLPSPRSHTPPLLDWATPPAVLAPARRPVRRRTRIHSSAGPPCNKRVHQRGCPIPAGTRIDSSTGGPRLPRGTQAADQSAVALASTPRLSHHARSQCPQAAALSPVPPHPPLDWPATTPASAPEPPPSRR
jgi:hypothetical protein